MRSVADIPLFENVPILVRAALNVPVAEGSVANDYRLRRAMPTIRYLRERGAKVVLISHIGERGTETLEPVARSLGKIISGVSFFGDNTGAGARDAVRKLAPGGVLVLENLRRNRGEKMNDREFARELAALADVFVQDSFDTCHRRHASIVSVPEFLPSYAGFLLQEEMRELSRAMAPEHPALAVIGGVKFNTKEAVLGALAASYEHVFVGGALANDFFKASGREVGKSLVSAADSAVVRRLLANSRIVLPVDSLALTAEAVHALDAKMRAHVAELGQVRPNEIILDHGPKTSELLRELVHGAKTVLWNGPLGNYERGFTDATDALAYAIAESGAHSIVGGGDTVAAIEKRGLLPHFSFVSTGGGAMLEYLAHGTLPGIAVLDRNII